MQGISYGSQIKNTDVLGIACCETHPKEICGTFSLSIQQQLCTTKGDLRYGNAVFSFLQATDDLKQVAFMAGVAIGAASNGILILSDELVSTIALKYALLLAPEIKPYLMFTCPGLSRFRYFH